METNNRRQMGVVDNTTWSKIRFHSNASLARNKRDKSKHTKAECFGNRNSSIVTKTGNQCGTTKSSKRRFLQYTVTSTEKDRRSETCNKSKTIKRVSEETTFQNGHSCKSSQFSTTRRLSFFSGSTDAYPYIPIHPKYRKFLHFHFQ